MRALVLCVSIENFSCLWKFFKFELFIIHCTLLTTLFGGFAVIFCNKNVLAIGYHVVLSFVHFDSRAERVLKCLLKNKNEICIGTSYTVFCTMRIVSINNQDFQKVLWRCCKKSWRKGRTFVRFIIPR